MNQPDDMAAWPAFLFRMSEFPLFKVPSADRPGQNVVLPVTGRAKEIRGFYLKNHPLQLSSTSVQTHQSGIRHCLKYPVEILSLNKLQI